MTALLLCALGSAGSLLVGAGFVSLRLPGGLPVGNLLAAAVFCGLAGAAALLAPQASLARRLARLGLWAAIAWLPLSIALAGNASLNFSGQRGVLWLWLSAGLLTFVLCTLVLAGGAAWLARRKHDRAA